MTGQPTGTRPRDTLFPVRVRPGCMNRLLVVGLLLTGVGAVGYAVGVVAAYPGRSFSVTAVMLGLTLIAVRAADEVTA